MENFCRCRSGLVYQHCCEPYHKNVLQAPTPEALMRSRYSAFSLQLIDYLVRTTHPFVRNLYNKKDIAKWAKANNWLKLEILSAHDNRVCFKAYYQNGNQYFIHHEDSTFEQENGIWYYVKGMFPKENSAKRERG